jgi:Domain of unknown function (DUF932)
MEVAQSNRTWFGQNINTFTTNLRSVSDLLPLFEIRSFGNDKNTNDYMNLIVRLPILSDDREMPVAVVSKKYFLIQHHQVVEEIYNGLKQSHASIGDYQLDVCISEYGERMQMQVRNLHKFDPGDGFPVEIQIECLNSVDRSCALEVRFKIHRQVCSNGLYLRETDVLRKIHHRDWISHDSISGFISDKVAQYKDMSQYLSNLYSSPVHLESLELWAQMHLVKQWGIHSAVRFMNIAMHGRDGQPKKRTDEGVAEIANNFDGKNKELLQLRSYYVDEEETVPAACAPIKNEYHVMQVLSWIAGKQGTVDAQLQRMQAIPNLICSLQRVSHGKNNSQ